MSSGKHILENGISLYTIDEYPLITILYDKERLNSFLFKISNIEQGSLCLAALSLSFKSNLGCYIVNRVCVQQLVNLLTAYHHLCSFLLVSVVDSKHKMYCSCLGMRNFKIRKHVHCDTLTKCFDVTRSLEALYDRK